LGFLLLFVGFIYFFYLN